MEDGWSKNTMNSETVTTILHKKFYLSISPVKGRKNSRSREFKL